MDVKTRRVRIRTRAALALGIVRVSITIGSVMVHFLEGFNWIDSLYLSVTSVTTVGYGDYPFSTMEGRLFASVWLLISTVSVARAFLYLAELRIERATAGLPNGYLRRRSHTKISWQLILTMMVVWRLICLYVLTILFCQFRSISDFAIYKLEEMGKICDKDLADIFINLAQLK